MSTYICRNLKTVIECLYCFYISLIVAIFFFFNLILFYLQHSISWLGKNYLHAGESFVFVLSLFLLIINQCFVILGPTCWQWWIAFRNTPKVIFVPMSKIASFFPAEFSSSIHHFSFVTLKNCWIWSLHNYEVYRGWRFFKLCLTHFCGLFSTDSIFIWFFFGHLLIMSMCSHTLLAILVL